MNLQTFPISPAESNLVNRITFLVILLSIPFFLFLVFDSSSILSTVMLALTIVVMTYLLLANRFTKFSLENNSLHIKGTLYGKTIARETLDIENAEVIDWSQDTHKDYRPIIRTNGIGLPYYQAGWFRLKNKQKALLFVTSKENVVSIPTHDGYLLMLSVDNPDAFLQKLKN